MDELGRTCARYGGNRIACRVLVHKTEDVSPLGRHRRRWEDNIETDLMVKERGQH
jgi:hypothetical protein